MRVSLFITCFNDTLFPETGKSMVRLLERLGHEVDFPAEQTCCGQIHYNTGYQDETVPLMRHFLDVFESADVIVAPSASCVGLIREYYPKLAGNDETLKNRIRNVSSRVFELSEFLVNKLGVEDVGAYYPHTVTYHPTCHSLRVLKVGDAPLKLLGNVRQLKLVELPEAVECCGFGGTFAVKNADTSSAMLQDKIDHIRQSGAEVCVASDNSCLMHIGGALSRRNSSVKTVHIAEILASTEDDV